MEQINDGQFASVEPVDRTERQRSGARGRASEVSASRSMNRPCRVGVLVNLPAKQEIG